MTRAIRIEELKAIDGTSAQILRVISLHLGEKSEGWVDYKVIAKSLNLARDTVRKSVNRMVKDKVLKKEGSKLSIVGAVIINETEGVK